MRTFTDAELELAPRVAEVMGPWEVAMLAADGIHCLARGVNGEEK